uniref:G-protein coupled receptors family 1 profile domain-containing protein n=1 Tax=Cyprinus carpio TaxID=7962 RepID=A0A8C1IEL0_CYPCA
MGDSLMAYETEDHETQYCFPAINSSCIKGMRSRYKYYIMFAFFSLLSAWTVFLNLLVIISISHFKKLHTPTNLLILSLAVADMLVGLIVMPIEATRLIETCWYFGETFCRLFFTVMGLLFSASLSNLVLIAVDRFVAVCHPLLYPQKITTTKTLIIVKCTIKLTFDWTVIDLFLSFLIPCTLIMTLYLRIFYVAHQQVKVINSLVKGGKHINDGSVKRKSERKAALTLRIIVTVYLVCWIPFFILSFTGNTGMASTTAYILLWILYINSATVLQTSVATLLQHTSL